MKAIFKQYLYLVLAVIAMTTAVNTVVIPYNIISGGVSGLSAIVGYTSIMQPALFVFLVNSILIVIAYFFISKSYAFNSILGGAILTPICMLLIPVKPLSSDVLLSSIFGGFLLGLCLFFLSKSNGSTGGTAITGKLIQKATGLPYGISVSLCDSLIVLSGLIIFGIENTLYAFVFIIISSLTSTFFEQGAKKTAVFHIISDNHVELQKQIKENIDRGITSIESIGGYSGDKRIMLVCVVKTKDIIKFKNIISEVDPKAFYYIVSASSTYGEGFSILSGTMH